MERAAKRRRLTPIPEYRFEPLEHPRCIRILVLQPALIDEDPLVAHIEQRTRRTSDDEYDVQDYGAVSYVWGKAIFSHEILCDGARLAITGNVDKLLRRFRRRLDCRRLWIDAICLNQADDEEKQQQVPLMREIYEEASRVLVWFDNSDSDGLELAHKLRSCAIKDRLTSPDDPVTQDQLRDFSQLEEALAVFFRNPWFTRRWVLQEVTAHPDTTVYFGLARLSWAELACAASFLECVTDEPDLWAILKMIRGLGRKSNDLLDLLWTFHDAACSEPRDRIDALLGMSTRISWRPDYSRDWAEEYERFARDALSNGNAEKISKHLVFFGQLSDEVPSCPTWVPNWSRTRKDVRELPFPSGFPTMRASFLAADIRGYFELSKARLESSSGAHFLHVRLEGFANNRSIFGKAARHTIGTHRDVDPERPIKGLMHMLSNSRVDVPGCAQSTSHDDLLAFLISEVISVEAVLEDFPPHAKKFQAQLRAELLKSSMYEIVRKALNVCFSSQEPPALERDRSYSLLEVLFVNDLIVPLILDLLEKCTIFETERFDDHPFMYGRVGVVEQPALVQVCPNCPKVFGLAAQFVSVGQSVVLFDNNC